MRVRHLINEEKTTESAGQWSTKDLQPRYAPIYTKTKPIRRDGNGDLHESSRLAKPISYWQSATLAAVTGMPSLSAKRTRGSPSLPVSSHTPAIPACMCMLTATEEA